MLISFSGLDSSGKSTFISFINDRLRPSKTITIWSRGGYTPFFEFLKSISRLFLFKRLPNSGPSSERTKMLKHPVISFVWMFIALLDYGFMHLVFVRVLLILGRVVILDRYHIDTEVDFLLYHKKSFRCLHSLWRFIVFLSPNPSFSIFLTVDQRLPERSILKSEKYPETLALRSDRCSLYNRLLSVPPYSNSFVLLDSLKPTNITEHSILSLLGLN